jgi:hypothetical protein
MSHTGEHLLVDQPFGPQQQETAQMAAWIVEDPAPKGKKFQ